MSRGRPKVPLGTGFLTALVAVLAVALLAACRRAPEWNGEVVEPAALAPQLAGVNWDGRPFRLSDLRGQVALVFFGYTYCPDVCPFTLAKMKQLYARLGPRAGGFKVVFVTVDPKRDTVEKLARYVPGFDRRFYGVRPAPAELDAAARDFDVTVRYGQSKDADGSSAYYFVDHTPTYFLVDRAGRLRLKYPPTAAVELMLPDVERLLAAAAEQPLAGLEVRDARAVVTGDTGAVYLTVVNRGAADDRLLSVSTRSAAMAHLHESVEASGVMHMAPRSEGLAVPAGGTLELQPGGKHIMLMGPKAPAGAGGRIALTLHFQRAGAVEVEATVSLLGGEAGGGR